ncbi:ComF family protein [Patescibacteria group bacterium]
MEKLLNSVFPPKCLFCEANGNIFCEKCLLKCKPLEIDICLICGKFSHFGVTHKKCLSFGVPASIFSCYEYWGLVRTCIKKAKYGSKLFSALNKLINESLTYSKKCGLGYKNMIVAPIPLNKRKYRTRGFNQAALIAKNLANFYNLEYQNSSLTRKKDTFAQYNLGKEMRKKNLQGAFEVKNISAVKGKKVLLVDDICTSGATLLEASRVLYKADVARVHCFTLARKM